MSVIETEQVVEELADTSKLWETLQADHRDEPHEYQAILERVPPWGHELLLRLREHHPDSFAHSLRVAAIVAMALQGRPLGDIPSDTVALAALLHDGNKDVVPITTLDKNGPLTPEEREGVKPHAIQIYLTTKPHNLLVAQMAGGHHLHQADPYGHEEARDVPWAVAAGQQRIATADVVDALAHPRSYKPAWPLEKVRATLYGDGILPRDLVDLTIAAHRELPPLSQR